MFVKSVCASIRTNCIFVAFRMPFLRRAGPETKEGRSSPSLRATRQLDYPQTHSREA